MKPVSWLTIRKDERSVLHLHVQPGASRSGVAGLHDGRLKIAIASPPVEGKANKAMVKFLAKVLGVSPRALELVSGTHSRKKQVAVSGLSLEQVRERMETLLER